MESKESDQPVICIDVTMKASDKIFILVDVNNCYISCERVFRPEYNNRPAICLSNNDGTIVARSQEAKDLGIPMGVPLFKIRDIVEQNDVVVLSSNYEVYAEMSQRFSNIIKEFISPKDVEIYSIDETFADLSSYKYMDLNVLAHKIKDTLLQWIGLPVCVGIGRSKTESKIANHIAKKHNHFNRVCNLGEMDYCAKEALFQAIDVSEVWGVGRKNTKKLNSMNINTVFDLAVANPEMIQSHFSVVLKRTVLELTGISCIEIEDVPQPKQQIISSKSFGAAVTSLEALREAMSSYLQSAVKKLRKENSLCGCVIIFAESNPFDKNRPFFKRSVSIGFAEPTDSAMVMNKALMKRVAELFAEGVNFKKCGVILTCIESKQSFIPDLLSDTAEIEKQENLQLVIDYVKERFGDKKIAIGSSKLPNRTWSMSRNRLTQNYFSKEGLLEIKI